MKDYGKYRMLMNKYNHAIKYMRKVRNWMNVYANRSLAIDAGWSNIVDIEQYYTQLEMRKLQADMQAIDPTGEMARKYKEDNHE